MSRPDPLPSDEAVIAAGLDAVSWGEVQQGAADPREAAAYAIRAALKAIDMPRREAEVRAEADELRAERDAAIIERDVMRKANVTPPDADRPLGQSVEYWQDRALDYATALDKARAGGKQLDGVIVRLSDENQRLREDLAEVRAATLREVSAWLEEADPYVARDFAVYLNQEAE